MYIYWFSSESGYRCRRRRWRRRQRRHHSTTTRATYHQWTDLIFLTLFSVETVVSWICLFVCTIAIIIVYTCYIDTCIYVANEVETLGGAN